MRVDKWVPPRWEGKTALPSHAGHMTMETVFGQALALWLEKRDEHHPLESDMTGLKNLKGNLYLYLLNITGG